MKLSCAMLYVHILLVVDTQNLTICKGFSLLVNGLTKVATITLLIGINKPTGLYRNC